MHPRALKRIFQKNTAERDALVVEGLDLIVRHIEALLESIESSLNARQTEVVAVFAEEEAAKVLILLDMYRAGWNDQKTISRLASAFYNHLSRGIYVRMASMSPDTYGQAREYVDDIRESHYLDGPNEVDWIFRNAILSEREEALYVDLLEDEDGGLFWSDPGRWDDLRMGPPTAASSRVLALARLGCTSAEGLQHISETWHEVQLEPETHYQVVAKLNREILLRLDRQATEPEINLALDWQFPLGDFDLQQTDVDLKALQELRERHRHWEI